MKIEKKSDREVIQQIIMKFKKLYVKNHHLLSLQLWLEKVVGIKYDDII